MRLLLAKVVVSTATAVAFVSPTLANPQQMAGLCHQSFSKTGGITYTPGGDPMTNGDIRNEVNCGQYFLYMRESQRAELEAQKQRLREQQRFAESMAWFRIGDQIGGRLLDRVLDRLLGPSSQPPYGAMPQNGPGYVRHSSAGGFENYPPQRLHPSQLPAEGPTDRFSLMQYPQSYY